MDDYAQRYPTNVLDIASFLVRLSGRCSIYPKFISSSSQSRDTDLDKALPRVVHYAAGECLTKYNICEIFGNILKLPISHIIRDSSVPTDAVARPRDCHLSTEETVELVGDLDCSNFEDWWSRYLTSTQAQ